MKAYEQKYLLLKEKTQGHYKSKQTIDDNLLIPASFYNSLEQKPMNYQYAYLRLLFEINKTEKKVKLNSNYNDPKFFFDDVLNPYVYVIYDKEGKQLLYNLEDFIFETDKNGVSLTYLIIRTLTLITNTNPNHPIWDKIKGGEINPGEINTMILRHLYFNPVKKSRKPNSAEDKSNNGASSHEYFIEWNGILSDQYKYLSQHLEEEKPKTELSSYLKLFYKEREEVRDASQSGLLINNYAFDCSYALECHIGIDEKDCVYKHILELYSQGVSNNDDTEQTARFKQQLNRKNLILINSFLNLIYEENSNHVELHQLIKDLYAFEVKANKYIQLLADESSKNDTEKRAELVQLQESIRLQGRDLQNKMQQICPKKNSGESLDIIKGIALCITGLVISVLGYVLSPLSLPSGLIVAAGGGGIFAYGISFLIPKYSPRADESDYKNALGNLDEITSMKLN